MQRALDQVLDDAERVIESAQQRPPKRKASCTEGRSLHEKLYDIYVEECGKEPDMTEELTRNVHLLEKLVQRESLPHLVVNLLPGEEGFLLELRVETEGHSEIVQLPREERDFLQYLDAEELSPDLVDVLEKSQVNIFQSGCVITEVRDYRQCANADGRGYQSRHVLLRPTMQTLASDIQSITSDNQIWTQEDKLSLESQLILATAEPLCLDPSVSVACIENKLLYNKQKMNAPAMRRSLESNSAASASPQPELSCSPPAPELRAWAPDQKSEENQADQLDDLDIFKEEDFADVWKQLPFDLEVPSDFDVEKYAAEDWPFEYDDALSILWPDLAAQGDSLFGSEAGDPSQTAKPAVMPSLSDPFISGKMPHEKGGCGGQVSPLHSFNNDHSYSCVPGSQTGPAKPARQPKNVVKKRDKCPVRVPPGSSGIASLRQLVPVEAAEQPAAVPAPSAVPGQGGPPPPAAISLPSSSASSAVGKPFPAQQAGRVPRFPSCGPARQPARLPQRAAVAGNRARTLPTATVSSARASHITPLIQLKTTSADPKVIQLIGPVRIVRAVVRGSNPAQGSPREARAPAAAKPSSPPAGGQPQSEGPAAPEAASQGSEQYVLGHLSSLRPIKVLWVPEGSEIANLLQQTQQPQHLLCQLVPPPPKRPPQPPAKPPQQPPRQPPPKPLQPPPLKAPQQPPQDPPVQPLPQLPPPQQPPPAARLQQPAAQVCGAQGASSHPPALCAQPAAAAVNLNGVASFAQPPQAPPAQPVQPPSPRLEPLPLPPASQQLPQPPPLQGRGVPLAEPVAPVAASEVLPAPPGVPLAEPVAPEGVLPAPPGGGPQAADQAGGQGPGGPPGTPRC